MKTKLLKKIFSKKAMVMVLAGVTVASSLTPAMAAETTRGTVTSKVVSQSINSYNQYVYDGNKTDFTLSGRLLPAAKGWGYIENGKVNTSKSGLFPSSNGWFIVRNGWVDFNTTGLKWLNGDNYYSFNAGKVVFTDNGIAMNLKGNSSWWYVKDGKIDKSFSGFAPNQNGIWRIDKGQVNFSYGGIWHDENSVFSENKAYMYFKDGKFDVTANTVAKNENGWWKITNGQVDFNFNGLAKNDNGWWYIQGGRVPGISDVTGQSTFNGAVENDKGIWYVSGSKVDFGFNGNAYGFHFNGGKAV